MGQCNVLEKNGKCIPVTADDNAYVGLDVHKRSIEVTVRLNGQEVANWTHGGGLQGLIGSLMPLRPAARRVAYEAGPTGYGLCRALREAGLPAEVWPPGKVPQKANQGNKTDLLDSRDIAEYVEKDLVKPIVIPTEQEEAERQVMRTRNQLIKDVRRVKQQIKSFLLMHGVEAPEGLRQWTKTAVNKLLHLPLREELAVCLQAKVKQLLHLQSLMKKIEKKLRELARSERHAENETILRSHPGVGRLTAMNFILEIYQPERFEVHRQVSTFVGLVPRVKQSGDRCQEGPLIQAGRESLRSMLVQAAWQWVGRDDRAYEIYRRMYRNTGSSKKAIVAMARRLCVNLWCMLTRGEYYRPEG